MQWEPSCSVRTDGRTDMMKTAVAFRNSGKASKNNKNLSLIFPNHQSVYRIKGAAASFTMPQPGHERGSIAHTSYV